MSKVNDGGPAFPHEPLNRIKPNEYGGTLVPTGADPGMSLRDWFAGQALQAAVEDYTLRCRSGKEHGKPVLPKFGDTDNGHAVVVAHMAYALADAMIAEREKSGASDESFLDKK